LLIVVFLFALFSVQAEAETIKRQEFLKGSPEDVVNALMKFDFNGGVRQNPDTFSQWFPLTTDGEPDFSESAPYWACAISPVIRSYKVLGKETIAPDRVRVLVEVEMLAFIASAKALEKYIDQCYWPELSTTIYNSTTGDVIRLSHPLSVSGFIKFITDKEIGGFHDDYANREDRLISIAKDIRRWQFKVDVVLRNGKWLISSDLLPFGHLGLASAINYTKRQVEGSESGIKICAGLLAPPSPYYKEHVCPPAASPEKELIHGIDKLNILNAIKGEQK
jgi:hypothetical protein